MILLNIFTNKDNFNIFFQIPVGRQKKVTLKGYVCALPLYSLSMGLTDIAEYSAYLQHSHGLNEAAVCNHDHSLIQMRDLGPPFS